MNIHFTHLHLSKRVQDFIIILGIVGWAFLLFLLVEGFIVR